MNDTTTQKANAYIQQMNAMFGRIKVGDIIDEKNDFFDLLLSKNSRDVNKYIRQYSARTLASHRYTQGINSRELYVVFCNKETFCLLGSEMLRPDIKIPTYSELLAEHRWYQKTGFRPKIAKGYKTVDDLIEARIATSMRMINFLSVTLENGASPWEYVYSSNEGRKIQEELILDVEEMIADMEIDIKRIKEKVGPIFLLNDYIRNLRKYVSISRCLTRNGHS